MAKPPAIQFYVRDWTTDCNGLSVAAKGAWIQMLCNLHLADKYGELTKTPEAWARICGCPPEEMEPIWHELRSENVCDISEDVTNGHAVVTVVSRRMSTQRKEKDGARLRKQRQREKDGRPKKVTSPSASAVSAPASATAKTTPLPPSLDNPSFQKAWGEWVTYRHERRKPLTKSTIKMQLTKLAKTPDEAVAIIERSIEQGWTGLFPLDHKAKGGFTPAPSSTSYKDVGTQHE